MITAGIRLSVSDFINERLNVSNYNLVYMFKTPMALLSSEMGPVRPPPRVDALGRTPRDFFKHKQMGYRKKAKNTGETMATIKI